MKRTMLALMLLLPVPAMAEFTSAEKAQAGLGRGGGPLADGSCTDQYDGARYRQAFIIQE